MAYSLSILCDGGCGDVAHAVPFTPGQVNVVQVLQSRAIGKRWRTIKRPGGRGRSFEILCPTCFEKRREQDLADLLSDKEVDTSKERRLRKFVEYGETLD